MSETSATILAASPARPGEETFREFLRRGGAMLFDGAMGTMLYSKGVFLHRAFEWLNVERPALVREVHEAYVAAGAQALETNTFAANRFRLSPHGLAGRVEEINEAGVRIAREVAGSRAWVAGSIGPLGVRIEPFGAIAREEAREVFAQQAQALAAAGIDFFVVESFVHLPELEEAIRAIRQVSDLPVVAQLQVGPGGATREGVSAAEAAARLAAVDADVVGVNCSEALASLEALKKMRAATALPLSGQPNAGQPRDVDGRNIYLASPEYLVAWARRALRAGVRLLGGCCGTTPDHIRALSGVIAEPAPVLSSAQVALSRTRPPAAQPVPRREKSALARDLDAGRFVAGIEVSAPRGWVVDEIVAAARRLALRPGAFVSLAEGAPGARIPPIALAQLVRAAGAETLLHFPCRGRRLVRMQSELLGAYAMGAANLLVVTGDPLDPEAGAGPDLEVDSIGAVNLASRLNHGEDVGGNPIGKPTGFHVGVRLDPTSYDLERELSRFRWKVEAGAEFAVTSPIFEPEALASLLDRLPGPRVPVVAVLWPLSSALEAEFFEREMASVSVPGAIVERMRAAEKRGTEIEEGIAVARELAARVRPLVQGVLVAAPGGRTEAALAVLDAI
ncbi:MAG: bifunctional homocysteine S-methyltransferase/methylenetetrahydrofolate reductase [Planctomycetes bacterium]|nr:bifunctional homocysteine S-methyltransferase/methylenetetrahydrofolate reductase [Planctomycetota bacterium]